MPKPPDPFSPRLPVPAPRPPQRRVTNPKKSFHVEHDHRVDSAAREDSEYILRLTHGWGWKNARDTLMRVSPAKPSILTDRQRAKGQS